MYCGNALLVDHLITETAEYTFFNYYYHHYHYHYQTVLLAQMKQLS